MEAAAQSRQVPLAVVEATAYVNTRWEWINTPSHDGGIGPMNVTPAQMSLATSLTGDSEAEITGQLSYNFDAGTALIAHYHASGSDLASWQPAVAATQGPLVAQEVFNVMRSGASRTTSTGEAITLAPQTISSTSVSAGPRAPSAAAPATSSGTATTAATDYPSATWIPADPSNYTPANRAHDYPIDMIIIHDIEGSAQSAIQDFQAAGYAASAHYVVDYNGAITQMVREHDVAWHAGNWDYNTRSIGIEHAGFASQNLYTTAEYNASAALAASICSRWGVPMDRNHVIGHYQVPDPNNPGLYGGVDHHTDPGSYWNWTYYMSVAQADANALPSPPHLMPDPTAVDTASGATITWTPARTCHTPISGYTVTSNPGNLTMTLPATSTSATFGNLQAGTRYTFTVTAQNADGQDSQVTNSVIPGACTNAGLAANPATPQAVGGKITFSATSATCANPLYEFWVLPPGGTWTDVQPYSSSSTYTWDTTGLAYGTYSWGVWARDASSPGTSSDGAGTFDTRFGLDYVLNAPPCSATNVSITPTNAAMAGSTVTVTATAGGCAQPQFEFWLQTPNGAWSQVRPYSTIATYQWSTTGAAPGAYRFSVWTRNTGSPGVSGSAPYTYDSYNLASYTLTAGCPSMTAAASPPTSATVGSPVTITAAASGCSSPLYQFWLLPPGGTWTVVRPYSSSPTFTWSTGGYVGGSYLFSVWVRNANRSASYDAYALLPYTLTTTSCASLAPSTSPSGTAGVNTPVTISGQAGGCPNPRYEFWMRPPGGTWAVVQPYSSSASFAWNTSGRAAGTYWFSVWTRDASSGAAYDAYSTFQYALTVTPCTAMTAAPSPSTAAVGTTVTINANASGCSSPQFEYWVLPPGGTWTLLRGYSAGAAYTWSTAGWRAGSYLFSIWGRDSSSPGIKGTAPYTYDTYAQFTFSLTP